MEYAGGSYAIKTKLYKKGHTNCDNSNITSGKMDEIVYIT